MNTEVPRKKSSPRGSTLSQCRPNRCSSATFYRYKRTINTFALGNGLRASVKIFRIRIYCKVYRVYSHSCKYQNYRESTVKVSCSPSTRRLRNVQTSAIRNLPSARFELTDFVRELSTVLHVESWSGRVILSWSTTNGYCRREDESGWRTCFYSRPTIFGLSWDVIGCWNKKQVYWTVTVQKHFDS